MLVGGHTMCVCVCVCVCVLLSLHHTTRAEPDKTSDGGTTTHLLNIQPQLYDPPSTLFPQ